MACNTKPKTLAGAVKARIELGSRFSALFMLACGLRTTLHNQHMVFSGVTLASSDKVLVACVRGRLVLCSHVNETRR